MNALKIIVMVITLTAPASFSCNASVIHVTDAKKNPFLVCKNVTGGFNLPVGSFTINTQVNRLQTFTPAKEIYQGVPNQKNGMKLTAANSERGRYLDFNPGNKASFYPHFNEAVFDDNIYLHWFNPLKMFVIIHEDGHHFFKQTKECNQVLNNLFAPDKKLKGAMKQYYEVEHQCDVYARNKMIRNGYNDVQCIQAIKILLKPGNPRIQMLIDKIRNVQSQR